MSESQLTHQLTFLVDRWHEDEGAILAQAMRRGVSVLYTEALIEAYLLGQIRRERLVDELGLPQVVAIDEQRDALHADIAWGLQRDQRDS